MEPEADPSEHDLADSSACSGRWGSAKVGAAIAPKTELDFGEVQVRR